MGKKKQTTRGIHAPRCTETIDIEELLEWMLLNPESHPDHGLLEEDEADD